MAPKPRSAAKSGAAAGPQHPGPYVRTEVVEKRRVSVTDAAKHIGISRPGVSGFLNGRVAATPDMAARIERAFGVPAQKLLDMQSAFDAAHAKATGAPAKAMAHVPPFLAIKANDIEAWVRNNIQARVRLSVFLRKLVQSTGVGLSKVDFPGNDDAERPGWDGYVEATEGTPWIPAGISGWEFGTNQDIRKKAEKDFAKSVRAHKKVAREEITFVFVTPRRWDDKEKWLSAARTKKQWKDVRVYDASDIEQWLEQSLAAQTWFANETGRPSQDVRSLDKCWADWTSGSPKLTGALFDSAIDAAKRTMEARLKNPPDKPIVITADSVEEALAFLSHLLSEAVSAELAAFRDRVLVFDKYGVAYKFLAAPLTADQLKTLIQLQPPIK